MRLRRFSMKAVFVCGKDMVVLDTLSNAPLNQDSNETLENEVSFCIHAVTELWKYNARLVPFP